MTTKLELAKMGLRVVATSGVYKVVSDVIKNNTTVIDSMSAVSAARLWVGRVVIGSIVSDVAMNHVNEKVDEAVAWYTERKSSAEEPKSDTEESKSTP